MKLFLSKILPFSLVLLVACQTGQSQNALEPTAFAAHLAKDKTPQLIDVRTDEEFKKGHLAGAANWDLHSEAFDKNTKSLDKTKPVYVYCLVGGRSHDAAEKLKEMGYKQVYELKGGKLAWQKAQLPLVTDEAQSQHSGLTQADLDAAIKSNRNVLIDFNAKWCGPCKRMEPHLAELEKAHKVKVVRVDIDANPALTQLYQISEIPILLAYQNGKQVMRFEGYQTLDMLKSAFKDLP
jgi:thioredoxin